MKNQSQSVFIIASLLFLLNLNNHWINFISNAYLQTIIFHILRFNQSLSILTTPH